MSDDWQVVAEALNESCSDWQLHNKYLVERPDWYENGHAALARLREREAQLNRAAKNVLDYENTPSRASLSALRAALSEEDA